MLTCKDASQLISERQERPLTLRERMGLRLHLLICAYCRLYERQVNLMRRALHELGRRIQEDAASAEFPPEARERIRKALAERGDSEHGHKH